MAEQVTFPARRPGFRIASGQGCVGTHFRPRKIQCFVASTHHNAATTCGLDGLVPRAN